MTRAGAGRRKWSPDGDQAAALLGDDMAAFRAALGADFAVAGAVAALSRCGGDTERAIRSLFDAAAAAAAEKGRAGGDAPVPARRARGVKAELGFDGAAPPSLLPNPVKVELADEVEVKVKMEPIWADSDGVKVKNDAAGEVEAKVEIPGEVGVKVKPEPIESVGSFQEQSGHQVKQEADEVDVKEEEADEVDVKGEKSDEVDVKEEEADELDVKEEEADKVDEKEESDEVDVKEEEAGEIGLKKEEEESDVSDDEVEIIDPPPRPKKKLRHEDDGADFIDLTTSHPVPYLNAKPVRALPPPGAVPVNEWRMVVAPPPAELDQRPPDHHEWLLFKKSYATGLSTCRGRKLLDAGEVVHFAFPSYDWLYGRARVSARQAIALSEIVRFSTNRSGEIGKLSPVWAKCLAPLVSSSKVMIQGKMVFPMVELRLMQEVLLYVSFYINRSCLYLIDPENARHPDNPLRPLFKLLRRFGES